MSECHQIESMLSEYLDRDLPPETCAMIDEHLNSCAACGAAAESLRATVRLCREYRSANRPGPLPAEKHEEMKSVLRNVLAGMRNRGNPL